MEIKEKIESLKYLSQIQRQQFDERRKYEWKIVFTSLSFFVLCVSALYASDISIKFNNWVWIAFIIFALFISEFLRSLHKANEINKTYAKRAENIIGEQIKDENTNIKNPFEEEVTDDYSWFKLFYKRAVWAWRWQVIILLSFAIVTSILITNYTPPLPDV